MKNIMTIDLEDWYHCFDLDQECWVLQEDRVVSVTVRLLKLFEKYNTKATFFVLSDIAKRHPELLIKIKNHGHELGSHGSSHQLVYTQTKEEFRTDVLRSKEQIEEITNTPVISYRAPFFSITNQSLWALTILEEIGIKYDSSIFPVINHRYGIASAERYPHFIRNKLFEIPLSTYRFGKINIPISGGAYFRIFPFLLTKKLLRLYVKNNEPIIFYLHPWEIDVHQPRLQRYSSQGIRHYWNLDKTFERLRSLISEYNFTSIQDYYE